MLFYQSEEQNREKMANTASRKRTGIMHWTLGILRDLQAFSSLRVFSAPKQNPRPPTRRYRKPLGEAIEFVQVKTINSFKISKASIGIGCLAILLALPFLLYYGYCWGLWGRNSVFLQYFFQCNCPSASEERRYGTQMDVIVDVASLHRRTEVDIELKQVLWQHVCAWINLCDDSCWFMARGG